MIGWLSGHVLHHQNNGTIVLDVHGVGYEVHVAVGEDFVVGQSLELFIYTVVRDDAIILYGFKSFSDREFFELLLVTPGVGPSTALAALRTMSTDEIAGAIEAGDIKRISQIPGIGPKTASRIVLELKGKVFSASNYEPAANLSAKTTAIEDALRGLGYNPQEIRQALDGVDLPDDEATALREALQLLRRK